MLWDIPAGCEVGALKGHSDTVIALTFSPDGARLASASDDRTIRIWSVKP